ncbi:MAG: DUF177 domain-containing protein [Dehalococcoidales bacterium]|nr:DUF177 domain-containing protein [Dehalococcoidales bacterium]
MQINVSQLLKSSIGSIRNYEAEGTLDTDGDSNMVRGEVQLMRTNRGILARGTLETEVKLTCSRCLSQFYCPLKLEIEEEYFPVADMAADTVPSLSEESGYFPIDEDNILDLTEAVRQYVLLAIPMKPLCHQDCAGLCLGCGVNLNQTACHCPHLSADVTIS